MQLDMHYYGVYALARAAGIRPDAAKVIATASQFVDDNIGKDFVKFKDEARIDVDATAHHSLDLKNIAEDDQRQVWVPFHFLPGNEGVSYTERLLCRKNSKIAQNVVEHSLELSNMPYSLELLGITAHVYADTFSHYDFSGISSERNKIVNDSFAFEDLKPEMEKYIRGKAKKFAKKYNKEGGVWNSIKSFFSEKVEEITGALGHGAAFTYPDRPYLVWTFEYESPEKLSVRRSNPETFLEGCEALYGMFRRFAELNSNYGAGNRFDFSKIKDRVDSIIKVQAPVEDRIRKWQEAANAGDLFPDKREEIPHYNEQEWHDQRESLSTLDDSSKAVNEASYRFYQAASIHRTYVLRDLLPSRGLVVN